MPRLVVSQVVIICCLVFTCSTAAMTTDSWQDEFFWATIATVVVINVMVAIFQGGLSGVAAKFPPRYMGSVVQGQGLGGIFAASVNVLSLAMPSTSEETAAFYCFLVTIVFLSVAFVALLLLMRTEFFKVRLFQSYSMFRNLTLANMSQHYNEGRHCDAQPGRNASCGDANALLSSPEGDSLIPPSASGSTSDNVASVDMEQGWNSCTYRKKSS